MLAINNRFQTVILTAKRAAQLNHGAQPLIPLPFQNANYIDVAINEIFQEKVKIREPQ